MYTIIKYNYRLRMYLKKIKKLFKNYRFLNIVFVKIIQEVCDDSECGLKIISIKSCFEKIIKIKWKKYRLNY